jgi:hypothetical protein
MLGDAGQTVTTSLAQWTIPNNIPSGESVDTLLNSENSVYGQVGTKILADALPTELNGKYLYFTVEEDAGQGVDAYHYSSLDLGKPEMLGVSYYSTNQDKAELVLEEVSVEKGGEIVTIGGEKYLPLDIVAKVKNYGQSAENCQLQVSYRKTDANGEKTYLPLSQIGANGLVSLGTMAKGNEKSYITNNRDFEKDAQGNYIIQTDGTLSPWSCALRLLRLPASLKAPITLLLPGSRLWAALK